MTTIVAGTLALVAVILWRLAARKVAQLETDLQHRQGDKEHAEATLHAAEQAIAALRSQVAALQRTIDRLAPFETVADASEAAAKLLSEARDQSDRLQATATNAVAQANAAAADMRLTAEAEAERIRRDARDKATASTAIADRRIADADTRAREIIAVAERRAEEIAGDALRAVKEAKELERTARALENVIEGYGDRYIVPTHTLIDDLAEGFGHTEAGQQLKIIREQIRNAVRTGLAATCDYVEDNRRETAVRFVIDAFNGKADSILSRVKQDNIGTLTQELRDALALVNHNGKAFRDARITDAYFELRRVELHWAGVVIALRDQERDEQRRLKEQLREEEKARREFERAMRETAREEEILKKAMAKATEQLARATEEQKAKYELQLLELQSKLQEAEERNQRAISMAQQTRRGHVYIISNVGSFGDDVYKIGLTRRLDPIERIKELGDSSVPFDFDVHALIFAEDAPALETQLHRHFVFRQINKVNYRKEFFRVTIAEIRAELEVLGLACTWTMTAVAREYRESMAIEQKIAADPAAREAWLKRQLLLDPVGHAAITADEDVA